jgi:hypothetical protein
MPYATEQGIFSANREFFRHNREKQGICLKHRLNIALGDRARRRSGEYGRTRLEAEFPCPSFRIAERREIRNP